MRDDDELRDRIERSLAAIDVPQPPGLEAVARRARSLRLRRYATTGGLVAVVGAGLVLPLRTLAGLGGDERPERPAAVGSGAQAETPETAEVVCDGSGTSVLTPAVRPQRDGVHIRVDNRTGAEVGFEFRSGSEAGGTSASPGLAEVRSPATGASGFAFPPGEARVRCGVADDRGAEGGGEDGFVSFEVVDPEGLWVSTGLDCEVASVGHGDYVDHSTGEHGDLVQITRLRRDEIIEEGDVVERAGYPEATHPAVRIVRDGRVLAVVSYFPADDGGWLEEQAAVCDEAHGRPGGGAGSDPAPGAGAGSDPGAGSGSA